MPLLLVLVLALAGGFVLYEESPEFRRNVDSFVENLEREHHNTITVQSGEMEIQAAARPNTNKPPFGLPEARVGRGPDYYRMDSQRLAERDRQMRENYRNAVQNLSTHHSRDGRVTESMNGYYQSNYQRDASMNAYRQYRR